MPERTEYRVVGVASGGTFAGQPYAGAPRDKLDTAEMEAYEARQRANTNVRIQTRTVKETPWVDLPESKQGVDRG